MIKAGAVVELCLVVGDSTRPGMEVEPEGTRDRKGTRKLYPVAAMTASTVSRDEPSLKTRELLVK